MTNIGNTLLLWRYHTGAALFLGSILTFVVGSILAQESLDNLVCVRRLIRRATLALTMPGIWLAALSLVGLALVQGVPTWRLVAIGFVLLTSHVLIVPATQACLHWAWKSNTDGHLAPDFRRAYLKESIPGALNVLMVLVLLFHPRPKQGGTHDD